MTNWDGQVRNVKTSSSSPSALRGTRQPTSADLHAKDLKEYVDYSLVKNTAELLDVAKKQIEKKRSLNL